MRKVISELCGVNERSYYIWKNKTHPKLINLLELYFSEEEIKEFLDTNKIAKMENIINYEKKQNSLFNKIYVTKFSRNDSKFNKNLFWDFIHSEYDNIVNLEYENCKIGFQKYLLEYHFKLTKEIENEVGLSLISSSMNTLISLFQEQSTDFIYFIIKNMKSGFQEHINYLLESDYYLGYYAAEIYSCYNIHKNIYNPFTEKLSGEELLDKLYEKNLIKTRTTYKNIKESNEPYYIIKSFIENNSSEQIKGFLEE